MVVTLTVSRGVVAAFAAVSMLVLTQLASASAISAPVVVRATMWPSPSGEHIPRPGAFTFSPKTVKRGTVVFVVRNRAGAAYNCQLNSVSKFVRPNHIVRMTVVFKKRGLYSASCNDPTEPEGVGIAGQIRVT
jgi:uncharacterized cupredoxin-like copper-binding protein